MNSDNISKELQEFKELVMIFQIGFLSEWVNNCRMFVLDIFIVNVVSPTDNYVCLDYEPRYGRNYFWWYEVLAQGPAQDARRFSSYNINGLKFQTLYREQG